MKFVIVDTVVWSTALRKKKLTAEEQKLIDYLKFLIREQYVMMLGAIRQEILCGISDYPKFEKLRDGLEAFSDFEIEENDYVTAADFYNKCRSKGIQGSMTDFLICAVAANHNFSILSVDKDFENYKKIIDIDLVKKETWLNHA